MVFYGLAGRASYEGGIGVHGRPRGRISFIAVFRAGIQKGFHLLRRLSGGFGKTEIGLNMVPVLCADVP